MITALHLEWFLKSKSSLDLFDSLVIYAIIILKYVKVSGKLQVLKVCWFLEDYRRNSCRILRSLPEHFLETKWKKGIWNNYKYIIWVLMNTFPLTLSLIYIVKTWLIYQLKIPLKFANVAYLDKILHYTTLRFQYFTTLAAETTRVNQLMKSRLPAVSPSDTLSFDT